jgi:hypothetical protein
MSVSFSGWRFFMHFLLDNFMGKRHSGATWFSCQPKILF